MSVDATLYPTGAVTNGTTAPASLSGSSYYATFRAFNNNAVDVFDVQSYANGSPFLTVLTKFGRTRNGGKFNEVGINEEENANYPTFKFLEIDKESDTFTVNAITAAGVAGTNSTFTLVSTAGVKRTQMLRNVRTNEFIRVVSVDSATQITATRKVGDAPNIAFAANDVLVYVSTAVEHGTSKITDTAAPGQLRDNNVQKFMETIEITDEDVFSAKYEDKAKFIERRLNTGMYNLRMQLERAAIFGEKSTGTDANGKSFYTSEGAIGFARRGFTGDISGGLTTRTLEDTLSVTTEYMSPGNDTKILLLGAKAKSAINSLYTGRIARETIGDIKEQVETIEIGTGKFIIMQSPLMNATSGYDKHALIIDPGYFKLCYPSGKSLDGSTLDGKAKFLMDPTSTDQSMGGTYTAYMGFKNVHAQSAGLIKISA
jgi:hypothetical protein